VGDPRGAQDPDPGGDPVSAPLPGRPHPPLRIDLESVSKRFATGAPHEVRALERVSVSIRPGEFVSVEGPSGGGKTTFLNLIGLLERPSEGRVLWNGEDAGGLAERERARRRLTGVGFIFQRFFLVPTMTARENVELPLRAARAPARERRARALELLDSVGLSDRTESFPHQLSGGEEQRVAVARALANRPGVLLADEPTGELDRANTEVVLALLERAHRETGATVVLVTHNPLVAERAARHLRLEDGRLVEDTGGA
jgi:ABC-type lipoprotein export system ATPase subunit